MYDSLVLCTKVVCKCSCDVLGSGPGACTATAGSGAEINVQWQEFVGETRGGSRRLTRPSLGKKLKRTEGRPFLRCRAWIVHAKLLTLIISFRSQGGHQTKMEPIKVRSTEYSRAWVGV